MLGLAKNYQAEVLEELPEDLQDKIKVRKLPERGVPARGKELAIEKLEAAEEKAQNSRRVVDSLEDIRKAALKTEVDNDVSWEYVSEEQAAIREEVAKLLAATFWRNVHHKRIKEEAMSVFPLAKNKLAELALKKDILLVVLPLIDNIKKYVEGDHLLGLLGRRWGELSYDQKMKHLVHNHKSRILKELSNPGKRKHSAMKAVFQSCGEKVAGRKRYKVDFRMGGESEAEDTDMDAMT